MQKDSFRTEQKFTKTKTSLASAGASIMNSANQTGMSYVSVKDKALAKFDNIRTGADGVQSMSNSFMNFDDVDPEVKATWEARKIGPFSFDIDDEIQVAGCVDIEIITNEQVYDDLKEIDDIIDKGQDIRAQVSTNSLGKPKRKK